MMRHNLRRSLEPRIRSHLVHCTVASYGRPMHRVSWLAKDAKKPARTLRVRREQERDQTIDEWRAAE
eukprot:2705974-Amphidinium_carterae.2